MCTGREVEVCREAEVDRVKRTHRRSHPQNKEQRRTTHVHEEPRASRRIRPKKSNKSNPLPLPHNVVLPQVQGQLTATTPNLTPKPPLPPPHPLTEALEPCEIMRYDLLVVMYATYSYRALIVVCMLYVVCCMLYVVCFMIDSNEIEIEMHATK